MYSVTVTGYIFKVPVLPPVSFWIKLSEIPLNLVYHIHIKLLKIYVKLYHVQSTLND